MLAHEPFDHPGGLQFGQAGSHLFHKLGQGVVSDRGCHGDEIDLFRFFHDADRFHKPVKRHKLDLQSSFAQSVGQLPVKSESDILRLESQAPDARLPDQTREPVFNFPRYLKYLIVGGFSFGLLHITEVRG